jgi:hypothetical protein
VVLLVSIHTKRNDACGRSWTLYTSGMNVRNTHTQAVFIKFIISCLSTGTVGGSLAPNSRCAISIKNMLSNTSIVRIALYVCYAYLYLQQTVPTALYIYIPYTYAFMISQWRKCPISALETKRRRNWFWYPAHGGLYNSSRIGREIHSPKSLGPGLRPVGIYI